MKTLGKSRSTETDDEDDEPEEGENRFDEDFTRLVNFFLHLYLLSLQLVKHFLQLVKLAQKSLIESDLKHSSL